MRASIIPLIFVSAVVSFQVSPKPVKLPIAVRINATGPMRLPEADLVHTRAFASGNINVPITNVAVSYIATVGVGSPPTMYNLLVSASSSNTWIGAVEKYVPTSTSHKTTNNVNVQYGFGSFSGTEYTDRLTLAPGLVIDKQSIGVANMIKGNIAFDGVLGIGPTGLTVGTLSPARSDRVPTVIDNLFGQRTISSKEIGISFEPIPATSSVKNGELTFGGTDPTRYTGNITYVPVTKKKPQGNFWGFEQSIRYGADTTILTTTAGIADTGTTLILLPPSAFKAYVTATGAALDSRTGLLKVTEAQFSKFESLFFTIGNTMFEFTPNAQAWPRILNDQFGGEKGTVYLVVGNIGEGTGLGFINGFAFLERFYTTYDPQGHRLGFANTPFTHAKTN